METNQTDKSAKKDKSVETLAIWKIKNPPMHRNPVLFKQLFFSLCLPLPIVMLFIGLIIPGMGLDGIISLVKIGFIIGGIIFIACVLISYALTKSEVVFQITSKGVWYHAGKAVRSLDTAALVGGLVSMQAAGTAILAKSREDELMSFKVVYIIKSYARSKIILLKRRSRFMPMAVYCTPENFDEILSLITGHCPQAKIK